MWYVIGAVVMVIAVVIGILRIVQGVDEIHVVSSPHGPVPIPTDDELRAARERHPLLVHGQERLDEITGMRYQWCEDCQHWTDPIEWVDVAIGEGHKVTPEWVHKCPTEE